MGTSVLADVADGKWGLRSDDDSRNSRIDSRVRALGRVTMVRERLVINGSVVNVSVVVCVIVGQSGGEEGEGEWVELCALLLLLAVVFVVFTLASFVDKEESTAEREDREGWGCSCCRRPSAPSC